MTFSTHLTFAGDCEEAFSFYGEVLGGEITTMLRYGDTPMAAQVADDWKGKIVHASLSMRGSLLTGADVEPATYKSPQGFYVLIDVEGADSADRVFNALAERGRVQMAIQPTFWSPAFGVLVDRFGIPWEINGTPSSDVEHNAAGA